MRGEKWPKPANGRSRARRRWFGICKYLSIEAGERRFDQGNACAIITLHARAAFMGHLLPYDRRHSLRAHQRYQLRAWAGRQHDEHFVHSCSPSQPHHGALTIDRRRKLFQRRPFACNSRADPRNLLLLLNRSNMLNFLATAAASTPMCRCC